MIQSRTVCWKPRGRESPEASVRGALAEIGEDSAWHYGKYLSILRLPLDMFPSKYPCTVVPLNVHTSTRLFYLHQLRSQCKSSRHPYLSRTFALTAEFSTILCSDLVEGVFLHSTFILSHPPNPPRNWPRPRAPIASAARDLERLTQLASAKTLC